MQLPPTSQHGQTGRTAIPSAIDRAGKIHDESIRSAQVGHRLRVMDEGADALQAGKDALEPIGVCSAVMGRPIEIWATGMDAHPGRLRELAVKLIVLDKTRAVSFEPDFCLCTEPREIEPWIDQDQERVDIVVREKVLWDGRNALQVSFESPVLCEESAVGPDPKLPKTFGLVQAILTLSENFQ